LTLDDVSDSFECDKILVKTNRFELARPKPLDDMNE
jgi:hypothetical protein